MTIKNPGLNRDRKAGYSLVDKAVSLRPKVVAVAADYGCRGPTVCNAMHVRVSVMGPAFTASAPFTLSSLKDIFQLHFSRTDRAMRLIPREQWICDTCGETIQTAAEGWLEWLDTFRSEEHPRKYGFRIVRHASASPRNPNRPDRRPDSNPGCYQYDRHLNERNVHLDRVVARDGIPFLLAMIDRGPRFDEQYPGPNVIDLREWTELFRRLALPYYEEARIFWQVAEADGFFDGGFNEYATYSEDLLKALIEKYGDDGRTGVRSTR